MQHSSILPFCNYAVSQVLCFKPLLTKILVDQEGRGLSTPSTYAAEQVEL